MYGNPHQKRNLPSDHFGSRFQNSYDMRVSQSCLHAVKCLSMHIKKQNPSVISRHALIRQRLCTHTQFWCGIPILRDPDVLPCLKQGVCSLSQITHVFCAVNGISYFRQQREWAILIVACTNLVRLLLARCIECLATGKLVST